MRCASERSYRELQGVSTLRPQELTDNSLIINIKAFVR